MYGTKKIKDIEGIPIKNMRNTLMVYLVAIAIGLVVAKVILTCIMSVGTVDSVSMLPTIMKEDKVIISKLSKSYKREDIVVFKLKSDDTKLYTKRIIGVGGDKVSIHNGVVYVNKKALKDSYVLYTDNFNMDEIEVPKGEYFLLGDNRLNSMDSRYWEEKTIKKSLIKGKVVHVLTKK